jgi:PAS domain S-box-containing protein
MIENAKNKSFDGRYKTLFESVNAAAFLTDLDGKIMEANQKSNWLLGYDLEELNKMNISEIFPKSVNWPQLSEEILSKGGMNLESENLRKDGSQFPVSISTSLFMIEKKPVMLTLIWDITDRKEAEKQLIASEEKYQGLFECTTDGMLVLDARGEILDVNSKTLELFDLGEDKMVGQNFLSMGILTPKALSVVVKQFQDLLSCKKTSTHETEIIDKDGNTLDVEFSSFFLVRKDNEIDNFVLVIRDISDRKQTEIKLAREHELLQTLMDSIPDSIYFKDEDNKFIMVNKAKALHSNVEPDKMIGKTDYDFLPAEQAKKAFEDDKEVINTGKFIVNKMEKITTKDGIDHWFVVTKIPRFDAEGNIIGTMGISRDVTEWKKIENLYKKEIEQ